MQLSVSSMVISLVSATVCICLVQIILHYRPVYRTFRVGLIYALVIIAALRLALPFEFIHTRTIASKIVLPAMYEFGNIAPLKNCDVDVFDFIFLIWILGALTRLSILLVSLHKSREVIHSLSIAGRKTYTSALQSSVEVLVTCADCAPFVYGLRHPKIFLPDIKFSDDELQNILRHECQHIRNRDILQKHMMQVLTCVYWWFPPIYALRNELNVIIESRADGQVVKEYSDQQYFMYLTSLVSVAKLIKKRSNSTVPLAQPVTAFIDAEQGVLKQRIVFLLEEHSIRKTNFGVLLMVIAVPYFVTSVIVEPDYVRKGSDAERTTTLDRNKDSYLLHHKNRYYLFIDGRNIGQVDDIDSGEMKSLPIKEK